MGQAKSGMERSDIASLNSEPAGALWQQRATQKAESDLPDLNFNFSLQQGALGIAESERAEVPVYSGRIRGWLPYSPAVWSAQSTTGWAIQ